jgi:hypothetical protein
MQRVSSNRTWADVVFRSATMPDQIDERREFDVYDDAKAYNDAKAYDDAKAYNNLPHIIHTHGNFWFYKVENTIEDSPMAHLARHRQHDAFVNYLRKKYGRKWLTLSKDTEDDCAFLREWRTQFNYTDRKEK